MLFWRKTPSLEKIRKEIIKKSKALGSETRPSAHRQLLREIAQLTNEVRLEDQDNLIRDIQLEHFNPLISRFKRLADEAYREYHDLLTQFRDKRKHKQKIHPEEIAMAQQLEQTFRERFIVMHAMKSRSLMVNRIVAMGMTPEQAIGRAIREMDVAFAHFQGIKSKLDVYDDTASVWGTAEELLGEEGLDTEISDEIQQSTTDAESKEDEEEVDQMIKETLGDE